MPLVPQLRAEAVRRGLFPDDTPLRPEAVFALVRDMPYERASDRQPETIDGSALAACRRIIALSPRGRLRQAGVLSDDFWLTK